MTQLFKKFLAFCGIPRLITMFTEAKHCKTNKTDNICGINFCRNLPVCL